MVPEDTETPACELCGARGGIVVGRAGRFGMSVCNVACGVCGLVFVSPRPSHDAMMDYYRGSYREHYGAVRYPTAGGGSAGEGEPEYAAALESWHASQASNAMALGNPGPRARVLEVGCRHGRTLALMKERLGVDVFGVEPGPAEAAEASAAGVECFNGTLEEYATDERFDQIQLFHVLEHFHRPLVQLVRLRNLLAPRGKLVIEVPNVYQPYGSLEGNFFQNVHLFSFSPVTLAALCRRAGLVPLQVHDGRALFVVAERDDGDLDDLPLAYDAAMSSEPSHTAEWIAERLATYAVLERERATLRQCGPSLEAVERIVTSLGRPAFPVHTASVVCDLVEFFVEHGAPRAARVIATAAAAGPHDGDLRGKFRQLARAAVQVAASA